MSGRLSSCLLALLFFFSINSVAQTTLTVATAADLSSLQPDLLASFLKDDPAVQIRYVTGASAVLSQQIQNGAPYDVFLSANTQYIQELTQKRRIEANSVITYATGRVGILWKDGKHHEINYLRNPGVRFVALANPHLAPYGLAAQQALEHAGLWDFVRQKVVYGENVRQALELFQSGNADAVLTSASLLKGKNPDLIPAAWHQPIVQQGGIVTGTPHQTAAATFLHFLASPEGQAVFARYGFASPGQP